MERFAEIVNGLLQLTIPIRTLLHPTTKTLLHIPLKETCVPVGGKRSKSSRKTKNVFG